MFDWLKKPIRSRQDPDSKVDLQVESLGGARGRPILMPLPTTLTTVRYFLSSQSYDRSWSSHGMFGWFWVFVSLRSLQPFFIDLIDPSKVVRTSTRSWVHVFCLLFCFFFCANEWTLDFSFSIQLIDVVLCRSVAHSWGRINKPLTVAVCLAVLQRLQRCAPISSCNPIWFVRSFHFVYVSLYVYVFFSFFLLVRCRRSAAIAKD